MNLKTELAAKQEAWLKDRMCTRKKSMFKHEAAEIVERKPWFNYYNCPYCGTYHLTKSPNHKKYRKTKRLESQDGEG